MREFKIIKATFNFFFSGENSLHFSLVKHKTMCLRLLFRLFSCGQSCPRSAPLPPGFHPVQVIMFVTSKTTMYFNYIIKITVTDLSLTSHCEKGGIKSHLLCLTLNHLLSSSSENLDHRQRILSPDKELLSL